MKNENSWVINTNMNDKKYKVSNDNCRLNIDNYDLDNWLIRTTVKILQVVTIVD